MWAQTFSGGSGTQDDPWLISSTADLYAIDELMNTGTETYSPTVGKYFLLTQDIDDAFFGMIGTEWAFHGHFDGGGHCINLGIERRYESYVGLFGTVSQGSVRNLAVRGRVTGKAYVGGIVSNPTNGAVLENLLNMADVQAVSNSVMASVGGVAGFIVSQRGQAGVTVRRCANLGTISSPGGCVGGVIGYSGQQVGNHLSALANYGNIVAEASDQMRVGSVVGNPLYDDDVTELLGVAVVSSNTISGCMGNSNPETQSRLFYDAQLCPSQVEIPAQKRLTRQLTGTQMSSSLTASEWVFADGMLPRPNMGGLEQRPEMLLFATPPVLADDDYIQNIASPLFLNTDSGIEWTAANGTLAIGNDGHATVMKGGDDVLTATIGGTVSRNISISTVAPDGIAPAAGGPSGDADMTVDLLGRSHARQTAVPDRLTGPGIYVRNGKKYLSR